MSSEVESMKGDDEDFSCGLLLRDIEEISKALYLHKSPRKAFNSSYDHHPSVVAKSGISESKSNVIIQNSSRKDKKSSIWNWKPLKALTHIRNHRFNCCFFLHVHAIEGLPENFNNLNLCVTWKRKADILRTRPARVCLGMAEFEETLMHRCTVYSSRTGLHNSAKYEPKLFLLHPSVIGAPALDIGNHWIDLSRLLPLTMDEVEGYKRSSGKWTTSFKLTGQAKGAMLNVSFGFSILEGNSFEPGYFVKLPGIVKEGEPNHFADFDRISKTSQLHNLGSVPRISTEGSYHQSQSAEAKFLEEILPDQGSELSHSVTLLYGKLDERKTGNVMELDFYHEHLESLKPKSDSSPESPGEKTGDEFNDGECDVIEHGVEVSEKDHMKMEKWGSQRFDNSVIEIIDVAEIFKGEETAFDEYVEWNARLDTNNHDEHECARDEHEYKDNSTCSIEPAFEELDSAFYDMLASKPAEVDSLLDRSKYYEQESYVKTKSSYKEERLTKSLSLDDVAESIETDFLNMLSVDQSQNDIVSGSGLDPSRGLLPRRFEEYTPAWGNPILNTDLMAEQKESFCFTPNGYMKEALGDFDLSFAIQPVERNHDSVNQPLRSKRDAKLLENLETEALMHEWGLNEKAFQYSPCGSSGGFGSPVYLPAEEPLKLPSFGEGVGPIVWATDGGFLRSMNPLLFRNANNGARLIVQVSAPVVLPAAIGSTIMEILQFWASGGVENMCIQANELMPLEDVTGKTIQQVLSEAESRSDAFKRAMRIESDYVSFEDLVPMAITNIEGLLVEGLKIQSGMPDQEAPSSIRIPFAGNSASLGKTAELSSNLSSERAFGFHALDVDELVKCSVSMERWMGLDSGDFSAEDETDESILKLFAAHRAKSIEFGSGRSIREDEKVRRCTVFDNNLTMGLKVQLRDPLRNYEMVGSSMLALIQVERVYLEKICKGQENGMDENTVLEGIDVKQHQKKIYEPQFKVSEVHLAGLNVLQGNKQLWGTSRQHQSGSRWLLSSGMARSNKNLVSNSNAVIKPSSGLMRKAWPEDVLWSISFPIQGEAATWDEHVALNVHVRNPNIIFPTESFK